MGRHWFWIDLSYLDLIQPVFQILAFAHKALSADWLVRLLPSDQFNLLRIYRPQRKCSLMRAINTHCWQLDHFLCDWEQIDDVAECLSLESAVQGSHHHYFSKIGQILTEFDNIVEELAFINGYNLVFHGQLLYFAKGRGLDGFVSDPMIK